MTGAHGLISTLAIRNLSDAEEEKEPTHIRYVFVAAGTDHLRDPFCEEEHVAIEKRRQVSSSSSSLSSGPPLLPLSLTAVRATPESGLASGRL